MAKKKKKSTHRRSRRRVSGIGGGAIMEVAALAAGCVAGQVITQKFGDKLDPKIMAGLQAVGGILLASKGRGLVVSVGKGLAVSGMLAGAKSLNLISGIGAAPLVTFNDNSLGFPNQSVIQGFQNPNNVMAGMNEMAVIAGATESYY